MMSFVKLVPFGVDPRSEYLILIKEDIVDLLLDLCGCTQKTFVAAIMSQTGSEEIAASMQRPGDWDPLAEEVLQSQLAVYDQMRDRCPVAYSEKMGWSVFRHAHALHVLGDPKTYSSVVSEHPSVPNGFDPPRHTQYRQIIEPLFAPEEMQAFKPTCRRLVKAVLEELQNKAEIEVVREFAEPFSARSQCAFLGWPLEHESSLLDWMKRSRRATLSGDRDALTEMAQEFSKLVTNLLASPRGERDILGTLKSQVIDGIPLSHEEIVSLARNWTVGELGSLSASIAIVVHGLATNPQVQEKLRSQADSIPYAVDEFLRIHGPLLSNRRRTTSPVLIGDQHIDAGENITILWPSANRDAQVFENPDDFQWDRNLKDSLLYGQGIHVCPGAPLARLELTTATEVLLESSRWIELSRNKKSQRASYPASGFSTLPIVLEY